MPFRPRRLAFARCRPACATASWTRSPRRSARRYPTRGELVTTRRELAQREAIEAIRAARTTEGTAAEALERVVAALLPVADRYAVLVHGCARRDPDSPVAKSVLAIFRRGRRSG